MNKKKNECKCITATVQTARDARDACSLLERIYPLQRNEFHVYDAIRGSVPIVDAAIEKLIRLVGTFTVKCESEALSHSLETFLGNVPSGSFSKGIDSFIGMFLDSLLMYGTAVGEMVCSRDGDISALYCAPLDDLEIKRGDGPFKRIICVRRRGESVEVPHSERILTAACHPTAKFPEGRSILEGLPFVTSVLLKIYSCIGSNFERLGNLRYSVTYKPTGADAEFGESRAAEIAKEWSEAMSSTDTVRDFVAVGDVDIKVIGADSQMLETEIPVRTMLEQIVAKTGIPPFMLGLSWSSTERMSSEQVDMLTSELEYYRGILNPVIRTICKKYLADRGYYGDVEINWNDISLKDEVELARARLLRAQAASYEKSEVK